MFIFHQKMEAGPDSGMFRALLAWDSGQCPKSNSWLWMHLS